MPLHWGRSCCFASSQLAGISGATHAHLKEFKIFINNEERAPVSYMTASHPPCNFSPHHWQQVYVNTSIKLDSWPAGSDKRKDVFERGKKDDVHFGGDGKTVPVIITRLFSVLRPQFPQSKPLMCFRLSQFGGWLITMK